MPAQRHQLFFYWRVAPGQTEEALRALQVWQAGLQAQHPGLQARCYLRRDAAAGRDNTVMESYALRCAGEGSGVDAVLRSRIEQGGDRLLQRWLIGPRHLELFDEWPPPV